MGRFDNTYTCWHHRQHQSPRRLRNSVTLPRRRFEEEEVDPPSSSVKSTTTTRRGKVKTFTLYATLIIQKRFCSIATACCAKQKETDTELRSIKRSKKMGSTTSGELNYT